MTFSSVWFIGERSSPASGHTVTTTIERAFVIADLAAIRRDRGARGRRGRRTVARYVELASDALARARA